MGNSHGIRSRRYKDAGERPCVSKQKERDAANCYTKKHVWSPTAKT